MASREIDPQLPFIQVHRTCTQRASQVSMMLKLPINTVVGSLVMFWMDLSDRRILAKLGQSGQVVIDPATLAGKLRMAFGQEVNPQDLVLAGFLDQLSDGNYRVRGMSRQLGVEAARKAKVGRPVGMASRRGRVETIGDSRESKDDSKSISADAGKTGREQKEPKLSDLLIREYELLRQEPYVFQVKDGVALAKLKAFTPEQVLERWSFALQAKGDWLRISTIPQLAMKWADLGDAMAKAKGDLPDYTNKDPYA